jgi:hypothetical protein
MLRRPSIATVVRPKAGPIFKRGLTRCHKFEKPVVLGGPSFIAVLRQVRRRANVKPLKHPELFTNAFAPVSAYLPTADDETILSCIRSACDRPAGHLRSGDSSPDSLIDAICDCLPSDILRKAAIANPKLNDALLAVRGAIFTILSAAQSTAATRRSRNMRSAAPFPKSSGQRRRRCPSKDGTKESTMITRQIALATCAVIVLSVSCAYAGPCNTGGKDAGSGPTPGATGQSITTGSADTKEHPPTKTMNQVAGDKAMSAEDAQKQQQGQPTAAQQAQGAQPSEKLADQGC